MARVVHCGYGRSDGRRRQPLKHMDRYCEWLVWRLARRPRHGLLSKCMVLRLRVRRLAGHYGINGLDQSLIQLQAIDGVQRVIELCHIAGTDQR